MLGNQRWRADDDQYAHVAVIFELQCGATNKCDCHPNGLYLRRVEHGGKVLHSELYISMLTTMSEIRLYSMLLAATLMTQILLEKISNSALSSICIWLMGLSSQFEYMLVMMCHLMDKGKPNTSDEVSQRVGERTEAISKKAMVLAVNGVINYTLENKKPLCLNLILAS